MSREAPIPRDDEQRLRSLAELGVLDSGPEEAFDRIARLAAVAARAPMACVTMVDRERQWTKAAVGIDADAATSLARRHAFCAHAILGEGVMEVEDAADDPRFADHPWVAGAPFVRFYAGAPLTLGNGQPVGTLCVMDTVPRPPLEREERASLVDLAALCVDALEARRDRRDLSAARAEVERLATHDALTGLLDRRGLGERLSTALALARRTGGSVTATLLDLEGFAALNDDFGHEVGDEVLRAVAWRLRDAVRDHDLVARTGGDEFTVVLQAGDESAAVVVAARLLAELARPCVVAGITFELRACAGVASFPRDAEDLTGLLRAADVALARAKAEGGGALAYVPDRA